MTFPKISWVDLSLLGLLAVVISIPADVSAEETKQEAISGDQNLERQKTIVWLEKLLKEVEPKANLEIIPGRGNSIILKGGVEHAKGIKNLIKIARSQQGAFHGDIVNALYVEKFVPVLVEVLVACVDSDAARKKKPELYRKWAKLNLNFAIEGKKCGIPFLMNSREDFLACLEELRGAGLAKILHQPRLSTLSGRAACFQNGGVWVFPTPGGNAQSLEFGTRLNILPVVPEIGKIQLNVVIGISSFDSIFKYQTGERTSNWIELESGQTFAKVTTRPRCEFIEFRDQILGIFKELPVVDRIIEYLELEKYCDGSEDVIFLVTPKVAEPENSDGSPKGAFPAKREKSP